MMASKQDFLDVIQYMESRGNPNAVSPAGASGTMQTMPATRKAPGFGVMPARDSSIEEGDRVGRDYALALLNHYSNDPSLALAAYNAGPGNVNKYGGVPPFAETQKYVKEGLNYLQGGIDTPEEDDIAEFEKFYAETNPTEKAPDDITQFEDWYARQQSQQPQELPERTAGEYASDVGTSVEKGILGAGQAVVGLGDLAGMPFGVSPGKYLEEHGYDMAHNQDILSEQYSPQQKEANKRLAEAHGISENIKAAWENPSAVGEMLMGSAPAMIAGGMVGRASKVLGIANPYVAAGLGEGAITAGQTAEQLREQAPDKELTGKGALASVGAGVGTGVLGGVGSKLVTKIGGIDANLWLSGGAKEIAEQSVGEAAKTPGFFKKALVSAFGEGVLEEAPQSAQEQMWQNYATDKPLLEGVEDAAVKGAIVGSVMGGGASTIHSTLGGAEEEGELKGKYTPEMWAKLPEFLKNKREEEAKAKVAPPAVTTEEEIPEPTVRTTETPAMADTLKSWGLNDKNKLYKDLVNVDPDTPEGYKRITKAVEQAASKYTSKGTPLLTASFNHKAFADFKDQQEAKLAEQVANPPEAVEEEPVQKPTAEEQKPTAEEPVQEQPVAEVNVPSTPLPKSASAEVIPTPVKRAVKVKAPKEAPAEPTEFNSKQGANQYIKKTEGLDLETHEAVKQDNGKWKIEELPPIEPVAELPVVTEAKKQPAPKAETPKAETPVVEEKHELALDDRFEPTDVNLSHIKQFEPGKGLLKEIRSEKGLTIKEVKEKLKTRYRDDFLTGLAELSKEKPVMNVATAWASPKRAPVVKEEEVSKKPPEFSDADRTDYKKRIAEGTLNESETAQAIHRKLKTSNYDLYKKLNAVHENAVSDKEQALKAAQRAAAKNKPKVEVVKKERVRATVQETAKKLEEEANLAKEQEEAAKQGQPAEEVTYTDASENSQAYYSHESNLASSTADTAGIYFSFRMKDPKKSYDINGFEIEDGASLHIKTINGGRISIFYEGVNPSVSFKRKGDDTPIVYFSKHDNTLADLLNNKYGSKDLNKIIYESFLKAPNESVSYFVGKLGLTKSLTLLSNAVNTKLWKKYHPDYDSAVKKEAAAKETEKKLQDLKAKEEAREKEKLLKKTKALAKAQAKEAAAIKKEERVKAKAEADRLAKEHALAEQTAKEKRVLAAKERADAEELLASQNRELAQLNYADHLLEGRIVKKQPAETAKPKVENSPEWAQKAAIMKGGTVIYVSDKGNNIALIKGHSILDGTPVFLGTTDSSVARYDIDDYSGPLFSDKEKAELIKAKKEWLDADEALNKANPNGPFEDNESIAFSNQVPDSIRGVVSEWKRLLNISERIYFTTLEDARTSDFHGPFASIPSQGGFDNENGSARKLRNGDYVIAYTPNARLTKTLETLSHEIGHVLEKSALKNASNDVRRAIRADYVKWLTSTSGKTAREHIDSLRARSTAKTTKVPEGMSSKELTSYWSSESEWFADQVARWATTTEKPLSVVEKFFYRLGQALKRFFLQNREYLPTQTMHKWLNSLEGVAISQETTDTAGEASGIKYSLSDPDLNARLAEMEADIKKAVTPEASGFRRKLGRIATYMQSDDAWFQMQSAKQLRRLGMPHKMAQDLLLAISKAQAVHYTSVAGAGIEMGDLKFNDDLKMFEGVFNDNNLRSLTSKLTALGEKYNKTADEMKDIYQNVMVARRVKEIRDNALEILKTADKLSPKLKNQFLSKSHNKSALELAEKIHSITDEQVEKDLNLIKDYPELEAKDGSIKMWDNIRKNAIKTLVDTGYWTEEKATNYINNAAYVPFNRDMSTEEIDVFAEDMQSKPMFGGKGLTRHAKEHKIKGSTREVLPIIENMESWLATAYSKAIKNHKAVQMVDFTFDYMPEGSIVKLADSANKDGAFYIFRKGIKEWYKMEDPLAAAAFIGMPASANGFVKIAAPYARKLRNIIVLNPLFTLAQLPQDTFSAMYTSGLKNPFALPLEVTKEFVKTLAGKSKAHATLKPRGVVGTLDYSDMAVRRDLEASMGLSEGPKTWKDKMMRPLEHFAMIGDNSVRQAVYNRTKKEMGDSPLAERIAVERAFEIVNFRRRGASAGVDAWRQVVPFFGAYLQVQSVALKTLSGTGITPTQRNQALKTLAFTSAQVMAMSFLYNALAGGDDEYDKMDPAVRDKKLFVFGADKPFTIPLRQDIFLMPHIVMTHVYDSLFKDVEHPDVARKVIAEALWNSVSGVPTLPTMIRASLENLTNYDFNTGRPIEGVHLNNIATAYKANPSTSETAKMLGKIEDAILPEKAQISPIKLDHWIQGFFGTAAGVMLQATDSALRAGMDIPSTDMSWQDAFRKGPGVSAFIASEKGSRDQAQFYRFKEEVDKAYNTLKKMDTKPKEQAEYYAKHAKLIDANSAMQAIEQRLSAIRKEQQANADMPNSYRSLKEKLKYKEMLENEIDTTVSGIRQLMNAAYRK